MDAEAVLSDSLRGISLWQGSPSAMPQEQGKDTGSVVLLWVAMSVWTFSAGALYGITGALISELFEARVRYSGISLGYQVAGVLGGALAPLIATTLVQWVGGASWPVATYLFAMSFISLAAVYFASERFHVGIHDEGRRDLAGERG